MCYGNGRCNGGNNIISPYANNVISPYGFNASNAAIANLSALDAAYGTPYPYGLLGNPAAIAEAQGIYNYPLGEYGYPFLRNSELYPFANNAYTGLTPYNNYVFGNAGGVYNAEQFRNQYPGVPNPYLNA